MSNDFLKNSFLYSDEWNSFIKSYKSMMESNNQKTMVRAEKGNR